ncbi:MAG: hypothetical protein KF847_20440 [Pirellulales bacterium]|nr:hypothetical protein [Pirellulales bacterium]
MAEQLGLCHADRQDLEQVLRHEVCVRSRRYDPARGDWRTFLRTMLGRCAASAYQGEVRRRRRVRFVDPVDLIELASTGSRSRPVRRTVATHVRRSDLRMDQTEALQRVSPEDRRLLEELREASVSQAARRLRIPRSTLVDRLRQLARQLDPLNPGRTSRNAP